MTGILGRALVIAALAALALPGRAAGQERVTSAHVPDLDLVEPVVPPTLQASHYDRGPRFMAEVGASMGANMGAMLMTNKVSGAAELPALMHGRLRWGTRWSRTSWLRMRSAFAIEDAGPDSLTWMLTGRHDGHAQLGLGSEPGVGADMIARARFHHLGGTRRALDPVDVGVGAHTEAELSVTTALRVAQKSSSMDASAFTFPMTGAVRRIDYLSGDAAVSRALTRSVGLGVGVRMIDRHALNMLIELLGVSHARTELDSNPAVPWDGAADALVPGAIRQTTLRMAGLDLAIYEKDIVVVATGHTGWTWLRDGDGERSANLLEMQYGFKLRGEGKTVGLGFGRTGHATADGRRFVAEYRFEVHGEMDTKHHGGLIRASTGWLADKERDGADDPGALGRHAVHAEHWVRLPGAVRFPGGVQMGLYGVAAYEPAMRGSGMPSVQSWDPWQRDRGWNLELGGFMRWTAEHWEQR
jgi:hypothetical protein